MSEAPPPIVSTPPPVPTAPSAPIPPIASAGSAGSAGAVEPARSSGVGRFALRHGSAVLTRFGLATLAAAVITLGVGLGFDWLAFDLLGLGLLAALALGFVSVARPSRLSIEREIAPPRVPKGQPAIAFLTFANRGRRSVPVSVATQPFGDVMVRTVIPRLRAGESGTRAYRLPTRHRGVFDVPPLEVSRRDSYELYRLARRYAEPERIWVYPRLLPLRSLSAGETQALDGPSSDTAPHGSITFHRLREYVAGDDLRLVHWRSSAHAGTLLVKQNVDTSQPYTVVIFDQRPRLYTKESFEQAVDVAASVVMASGRDKAPVELRLTDGTAIGGPRTRDTTPLVDLLTGVVADSHGSLRTELLAARRLREGTSLIVVTGEIEPADLPHLSVLRRRFDRVLMLSLDTDPKPVPRVGGVRVIIGADADAVCAAWNHAEHA